MVYSRPRVIAEAVCNHKGDMTIAHEMIKMAAIFCKADAIKFQKRNNRELLTAEQYNAPHQNPANSMVKPTVNIGSFSNSRWSSMPS